MRLKLDELRAERAAAQEADGGSLRGTARGRGWYGDAETDSWLQARLEAAQRTQPEQLRAAQLSTSAIGLRGGSLRRPSAECRLEFGVGPAHAHV